jgi:hypothetical protein
MLWVVCSDLENPGDPEVLVLLHVSFRGVLSPHVYEMVILVHFALDYTLAISILGQTTGSYLYSLIKLLYFFIASHSSLGVTV